MSCDERREKARLLCEKLIERTAEVAPDGLAGWDRIWAFTDGPWATFMIALTSWESDPCDATLRRTSDAYDAVLSAWRAAAAEFAERTRTS